MFEIYDGRRSFWQWDLNQRIFLDDGVTQAHFCNGTSDCTLVVAAHVDEETGRTCADVPNILLQKAGRLKVYAYVANDRNEESYTMRWCMYDVQPRTRPANYAYTETEVMTWENVSAAAMEAVRDAVAAMEAVTEDVREELENGGFVADATAARDAAAASARQAKASEQAAEESANSARGSANSALSSAQSAAASQEDALRAEANVEAIDAAFSTAEVEVSMLAPSASPTGEIEKVEGGMKFVLGIPKSNLAMATFEVDDDMELLMYTPEGFGDIGFIINDNGELEVSI